MPITMLAEQYAKAIDSQNSTSRREVLIAFIEYLKKVVAEAIKNKQPFHSTSLLFSDLKNINAKNAPNLFDL